MTTAAKETAEQFKILSCETRVAIINLLKRGSKKVTEIADILEVSQPAISQHLKVLKSADLVADQKDGYWVSYSLNPLRLLEIRRELEDICRCSTADCEMTLEAYKKELEEQLAWITQQLSNLRRVSA